MFQFNAFTGAAVRLPFVIMAVMSLAVVGCDSGGGGGTTVKGAISYKGSPVTSGVINFLKQGDKPMGGAIASDGTFEFVLPPGEYQVLINAPAPPPAGWNEGDPLPAKPPLVPEKYANFGTSGLTASVGAESPQQVDFVIQ